MKGLPTYPNPRLGGWRFGSGVPAPNLLYRFGRRLCQCVCSALWSVEVFNRAYEPARGAALYICNHQSLLDPPLMGLALRRPMNFMARDTLFHTPGFSDFITALNAFPVKRGSADTGALKEALRRLKAGGQLVLFPEGTRTHDGTVGRFLPGVAMLAQRAADWVVPTAIDGAFECWPRSQPLPLPGPVTVAYCKPLSRAEIREMSAEEFVAVVRERIIEMQAELRRRRGKPPLTRTDR